ALRDLLKFEFFFAQKPAFRQTIRDELTSEIPAWEEKVAAGEGLSVLLDPPVASFALLPVLDAYQVVADELAATFGTPHEKAFMTACLERGRLYRLEGRVAS